MRRSRRRKSGRRAWRWLRFIVGVPLVLWLALNVFFATSWGTGLLSGLAESRFGVRSEFDRASWTPWSGVSVKGLRILPPAELEEFHEILSVESIRLDPSWWSLMKGRKRFERLEISGVKGEVSLELLKAVMSQGQTMVPDAPDPEPSDVKPEVREGPLVVAGGDGGGKETPRRDETTTAARIKDSKEEKPVMLDDFKGELVIDDAEFKIYSERTPRLSVKLSDVAGEIPLWGEGRSGNLQVGEIQFGDEHPVENIRVPMALRGRILRVDDLSMKVLGLNLEISAALWMTKGLPCGVQVVLPAQGVDFSPIFREGQSPIRIRELKSSAQLKGYLLNPRAVSGGSYIELQDLELRDLRDGSPRFYESGRARFRISPSGLEARELRLIGDQEAVLGNGFITVAGEGAAVVRVVADPTRADSLEKRILQAGMDLELRFAPLVTPDREFRDVRLELSAGQFMVDLGPGGDWVPCLAAVRSVMGNGLSRNPMMP